MIERFKRTASTGRISHAYIIEGSKASDKNEVAKDFAKEILKGEAKAWDKIDHGNYEDLIFVEKDGLSVKDEAIEELQSRLKNKPVNSRNIVIVTDADTMTTRAQNRLLKTLEEPTPGTVIMLLSENIENLQATIRSRCVHFKLNDECEGYREEDLLDAMALEELLYHDAPSYELFDFLEAFTGHRDSAMNLLDGLEKWYGMIGLYNFRPEKYTDLSEVIRNQMKQKNRIYRREEIYRNVNWIEEAKRELQKNMGVAYTMKSLMIKIGG